MLANSVGRYLNLIPDVRPIWQQARYRKKWYWKTQPEGTPLYSIRPGEYVVGTRPHPLKYFSIQNKQTSESYGLQGTNHLLPGKGKIALRLPVKMQLKKDKVYAWCSCGFSANQPLCDGSHKREPTKLKPVRFIPDKDMEVWFCACKQTNNRPFCDGTHETLPPPPPPPEKPPIKLKG